MDTISTMLYPTNSLPPKDRITVDSPPDWAKGVTVCFRCRGGTPCRGWIPACAGMTEVGNQGHRVPPAHWEFGKPTTVYGELLAVLYRQRPVPWSSPRPLAPIPYPTGLEGAKNPSHGAHCHIDYLTRRLAYVNSGSRWVAEPCNPFPSAMAAVPPDQKQPQQWTASWLIAIRPIWRQRLPLRLSPRLHL